jgi:hypothetical protein
MGATGAEKKEDNNMSANTRVRGGDASAEAARIIRDADALIAEEERKLDALRQRRDAVDDEFQVKAKQRAEALEASRRAQVEADCTDLVAAHNRKLEAVDEAEAHLKAYVDAVNRAIEAEADERKAGNVLSGGVRLSMALSLSATEFVSRLVGGLCAHLSKIRVSTAPANRIGSLSLANSSLFPTTERWMERERKATAPSIEALIEHGRNG